MLRTIFFYGVFFIICLISAQQSNSFKFCNDFQNGDFCKDTETDKNNGYRVDSASKDSRFDNALLITYMRESKSGCLETLNLVINTRCNQLKNLNQHL